MALKRKPKKPCNDVNQDAGIFATGNPETVKNSVSAIGVLPKPYSAAELAQAIRYASAYRAGHPLPRPGNLHLLG
ncbi:hypothetical protein QD357_22915 [Rhizobium sp. BR 317]